MSETNKEIVREFLAHIGIGDLKSAFTHTTNDVTWWLPPTLPNGGTHVGKRAIIGDMMIPGGANVDLPTMSLEIRTMIGDGDYVSVEWITRFTTKKGIEYENQYNTIFEVRNGRIEAVREYLDTRYSLDTVWA